DLTVEIRPKVSIQRLLFLLLYTADPAMWRLSEFEYEAAPDLVEALIAPFLIQVRQAVRRGILQGYVTEEERLATLRGRLMLDESVGGVFGGFPPVPCRYDEFTEDIVENRLIKAGLEVATRFLRGSVRLRRDVNKLRLGFENVNLESFDPARLPEVQYTRLN